MDDTPSNPEQFCFVDCRQPAPLCRCRTLSATFSAALKKTLWQEPTEKLYTRAELDAAVAAAYERAAELCEANKEVYADPLDLNQGTIAVDAFDSFEDAAAAIRALITPDQIAALEAVKRKERAEALREAADMHERGWDREVRLGNLDMAAWHADCAKTLLARADAIERGE